MIANTLLELVSSRLIEKVVSTTLTSAVAAPGVASPNVGSTKSMYVGALILVGAGGTREVVSVTTVLSATQFTATFAFAHSIGEAIVGATFSSGAPSHALWSQSEALSALAETQNQFLLETRAIYSTAPETVLASQREYTKPSTAIRIEHIHLDNSALRYISQAELDLSQRTWPANNGQPPREWFEDRLDPNKYGYDRIPQVGGSAELWFSQRGPTTLALDTAMTGPDAFVRWVWPAYRWGTLSRLLSKSGEGADPNRAKYSQRRFEMWVALIQRWVGDLQVIPLDQVNKFPTFALPRSA